MSATLSAQDLLDKLPFAVFRRQAGRLEALNSPAEARLKWCAEDAELQPVPEEPAPVVVSLEEGAELVFCITPENAGRLAVQEALFGSTASGFVHNLNNPLNAMAGLTQLMEMKLGPQRDLGKIEKQQDKLAEMIRNHGQRYRRLHSSTSATPGWAEIVAMELEFFQASSVFKHQCEVQVDLPEEQVCPLEYTDASWLLDRLILAVIPLAPKTGCLPIRITEDEGWPSLRVQGDPGIEMRRRVMQAFVDGTCQAFLAEHGRRLDIRLEQAELILSCGEHHA